MKVRLCFFKIRHLMSAEKYHFDSISMLPVILKDVHAIK